MFDVVGMLLNSIVGLLEGSQVMGVTAVWGKHTVATRVATRPRAANLGMHVKHGPAVGGISCGTSCEHGRVGQRWRCYAHGAGFIAARAGRIGSSDYEGVEGDAIADVGVSDETKPAPVSGL